MMQNNLNVLTGNLQRNLLYILIFLLPINLGKHFIFPWVYVNGLLIDYLVPTIFVQDILVTALLVLWVFNEKNRIKTNWRLNVLFLFLFAVFLSVLGSINLIVSIYAFLQVILYVFFALYIAINFDILFVSNSSANGNIEVITESILLKLRPVLYVFAVSIFFVSVLGILQWYLQSSVFNNYLFFGEQPYNLSTYAVSRESFFGRTVVPPYGTFRHPNILGGFLSIVIILLLNLLPLLKGVKRFLIFVVIFLAGVTVFLTLSWVALFSLVVGIILWVLFKTYRFNRHFGLLLLLPFVLLALNLSFFSDNYFVERPSFYRRVQLYDIAIDVFNERPLFGVGLNTSTIYSAGQFRFYDEIKHPQPIHNIFLLIFTEAGVFTLVFFLLLLLLLLYKAPVFVFIAIIQFIILGLFDHYVFTIHQTSLLFWFIVGLGLLKNSDPKLEQVR
jgi:O-antigen ligase